MVGWTFSFNRKGQTSAGPKGFGGVVASRRWYLVWCEGFIARGYAKNTQPSVESESGGFGPILVGLLFLFWFLLVVVHVWRHLYLVLAWMKLYRIARLQFLLQLNFWRGRFAFHV